MGPRLSTPVEKQGSCYRPRYRWSPVTDGGTIDSDVAPCGASTSAVARPQQGDGGPPRSGVGTPIAPADWAMTHLQFTAAPAQAAAPNTSATTRRNRLRDSILNLLISGIALGVALGLAEWLVRRVAPQQLILLRPDVWQPADSLGWVNQPNVNTMINTGDRTVRLMTDRDGFRVGTAG